MRCNILFARSVKKNCVRMTSFSYPSMVREFHIYRKLQMAKFCCSESEVLKRSSEILVESHLERSRSKYSIMTNAHALKLIGY